MNTKERINNFFNKRSTQIYLLIYFLIISILMFWPIRHSSYLYFGHDLQYHINRIEELYHTLAAGNAFSFVSTFTNNHLGVANNTFYPDLFLYLFAGLKFLIHNPIKAIYVGVWVINFATLLVSYFTYHAYSKSGLKAFIFANIYGLSTYRYIDILTRFDLGEYIALMFLPIVFWSFYEITYAGKDKYWPWLAVSIAGILYSHILTLVITVLFLAVVFICSSFKLPSFKASVISAIKAVVLFILLGTGFLFSFIKMYMTGPIEHPFAPVLIDRAYWTSNVFDASLNNSLFRTFNLGVLSVVIIVAGLLTYHKLNEFNKNLFIVIGILLLLTTKLFPWDFLQKNPYTVIQFPFRFLLIANLLLAVLGTEIFSQFRPQKVLLLLIPFLLITSVANVRVFKNDRDKQAVMYEPNKHPYDRLNFKYKRYDLTSYRLLTEKGDHYYDYAPWPKGLTDKQKYENFKRLTLHKFTYDDNQGTVKQIQPFANGVKMTVNLKKGSQATLPFYLYNTKNYHLQVNGQKQATKYNAYHNLSAKLKKGKNTVSIQYVPTVGQLLSVWVSIISFIALCLSPLFKKWRKKKNN